MIGVQRVSTTKSEADTPRGVQTPTFQPANIRIITGSCKQKLEILRKLPILRPQEMVRRKSVMKSRA